jgi:excisionase family DNA binding protein
VAESEELLTVAEIAAALKMNQQTIRNWIDSGFLPAIPIGRRVRVKRSDFGALLEASWYTRWMRLARSCLVFMSALRSFCCCISGCPGESIAVQALTGAPRLAAMASR